MSVFQVIRDHVDMARLAVCFTSLSRIGKLPRGRCPLPNHGDSSPSFYIYDDRAHCYGCGFHGDVVDLWAAVRGLQPGIEAALDLACEYGVPLPERDLDAQKKAEGRRRKEGEAAGRAEACHRNLGRYGRVAEWWKGRGFSDGLQKQFLLGANDGGTSAVIPFWSRGRVQGLIRRQLKGEPKYLLPSAEEFPEGRKPLFVVGPNTGDVHLVEGFVDALSLSALGLRAVAVGGAGMSEHQSAELLRLKGAVFILPDADKAGAKAGRALVRELYPRAVLCPSGYGDGRKDIADLFAAEGEKAQAVLEGLKARAVDALSLALSEVPKGTTRERYCYFRDMILPFHGTNRTKAEKRCTQLLSQADSGTYLEQSRMTVADYFTLEWLPQKRREGVRDATTLKTYESVVRGHVVPVLGALPLSRVTPRHVQQLYNRMQDGGLRDATMRLVRAILRMAFRQAVTWRYLRTNPAAEIKPPAATKPPRAGRAFTRDEALRFIRAASESPDDLDFLFHLFTGVRPEELAGLGWEHVSFGEESGCDVARIERVVLRLKGGGFKFAGPKTKSGRRLVFFPAHIHRALLAHRERQEARAGVLGALWRGRGLVFADSRGGPLEVHCTYGRQLRRLAKSAGIGDRVTPYTLRYSFATLALLAGELDVAVSRQMGHARPDFTKEVYVKVLPEMQQSLSGSFERLLAETVGNQPAHLDAPGVM